MPGFITAFDWRSFARSLSIALVAACLAAAVMAATDGESTASAARFVRLGALAPVFGALGSAIAIAQARARGEMTALESLGVSPIRAQGGALAGAMLIGVLGACVAVGQPNGLEALFPRIPVNDWTMLADGGWRSASNGIRLGAVSTDPVTFEAAVEGVGCWTPPRLPVMAAIGFAGFVLPVWLQSRSSALERVAVGAAATILQVALFHFVGAGRLSGWALLAGPALLLAHGSVRNATVRPAVAPAEPGV